MKRLLTELFALVAALVLPGLVSSAQDQFASGYGLDPTDSEALREINQMMDSIRRERPTVALVLSGGGAKGAAHVGAIRYLEEMEIPIDMVIGTSVGGLVGGLYALGYDAVTLDSLIRSIDWDIAMSDQIPREFKQYQKVKYKEKYILSIPFFYSKSDFNNLINSEMQYSSSDRSLHLGAGDDPLALVKRNLVGSLPSGFVFGQNVNSIFTSVSVGYSDSTDFFRLPIPFACVATDLVSGRAKVWHRGDINTAMRSTMSIPGLFTPVRAHGMVLVDGGMRNNFPADLAVAMGADIIIGVELSQTVKDYTDIHNITDIISQGIDMLGNDSFRRNIRITDLRIKPDLREYNMLSFNDEAIDTIAARGYRAAREKTEELEIIKEWTGDSPVVRRPSRAVDVGMRKVKVGEIEVSGVTGKESDYVKSKLRIHPGDEVGRKDLENAVATISGTEAFDVVTYELLGTEEPFKLRLNCQKGPVHRLGIGLRMDSEELIAAILNIGINTNALRGSSLDFTGKVGTNPLVGLHYAYDIPKVPTINVAASFSWVDRNRFTMGSNHYNVAFVTSRQEVYLSNMRWSRFDVSGGVRNETFRMRYLLGEDIRGDYHADFNLNDYISVFLNGRAENFDNSYFPSRGYTFGLGGNMYWQLSGAGRKPFVAVQTDARWVIPFGSGRFSLIPSLYARVLLGENIPIAYSNVMGGEMNGRYVDQQISFIGVNNAAFMRNCLGVARLDARFKLLKNNYLTGIFNYARDFNSFATIGDGMNVYGAGIEYAYNSIAGPLRANIHWSSMTRKVGFYISLGFDF